MSKTLYAIQNRSWVVNWLSLVNLPSLLANKASSCGAIGCMCSISLRPGHTSTRMCFKQSTTAPATNFAYFQLCKPLSTYPAYFAGLLFSRHFRHVSQKLPWLTYPPPHKMTLNHCFGIMCYILHLQWSCLRKCILKSRTQNLTILDIIPVVVAELLEKWEIMVSSSSAFPNM